ncbi:hypothetical protein EDD86DRAFT_247459 [Gorgonomyces haynaldii]|nr:hypothetical protein EDD86DRAFT_247459 [Gorgonomyces haynaldii]
MEIERPGGYFYPSAVLHGAALHECGCVLMIFVTKLIQDKNSWKKPLFSISVVSFCLSLISNLLYMFSLDYLMFPRDDIFGMLYYTRVLKMLAVFPAATNFSMQVKKSPKFLFLAILCGCYFCLLCLGAYLGIKAFEENIYFYLASTYTAWQLVTAISLFVHIAVVLGGTLLFLLHIANALEMSGLVLLREMATKHEGLRWVALLGMQLFSLITSLMAAFLTLYLFLESSYSAAKDMIQNHGMSNRKMTQVTLPAAKSKNQTVSLGNAESIGASVSDVKK